MRIQATHPLLGITILQPLVETEQGTSAFKTATMPKASYLGADGTLWSAATTAMTVVAAPGAAVLVALLHLRY